jgi:hypothetical protein
MRKLAGYSKIPFEGTPVGRTKFALFVLTLIDRLVGSGVAAYAAVILELKAQYALMFGEIEQNKENLNTQITETKAVKEIKKQFADLVDKVDGAVRFIFGKDTDQYEEFFPHGITPFKIATLPNTQIVMEEMIALCSKYSSDLGPDLKASAIASRDAFVAERDKQLQYIGIVKSIIPGYKDKKAKMMKLLYKAMLIILQENIDTPDAMTTFFDEALIWPKRKKKDDTEDAEPYSLTIDEGKTEVADISFDVDDTIVISLVEGESAQYYFAETEDEAPPATPENLVLDEEHEIQALSIGAPAKKFLKFINNGTVPATVEVFLE